MNLGQELLNITKRVKALLNISDEGKINHFYLKQRSQLQKDIKYLKKNLGIMKDQHEDELEKLEEQLEDAQVRVVEAYNGVRVEDVDTNEKAAIFAEKFWATVSTAEENVKSIKDKIEKEKERYNAEVESAKKQIEEREAKHELLN